VEASTHVRQHFLRVGPCLVDVDGMDDLSLFTIQTKRRLPYNEEERLCTRMVSFLFHGFGRCKFTLLNLSAKKIRRSSERPGRE
jgi:hypothetical protein